MTSSPNLDSAHIWLDHDEPGLFPEPTVAFWVFAQNIEAVHESLSSFLRPFARYPWFHSPPQFALHSHESIPYLYGNLVYDSNVNDEWLLVRLLYEYLLQNDAMIGLWDSTDGDFLLVELEKQTPEWLQPANSRNRCCLRGGQLYLSEKGSSFLPLEEAIKMARVGLFSVDEVLSGALEKRLKLAETYYTELVYDVPRVFLCRQTARQIYRRPWLASRAIVAATSKTKTREQKKIQDQQEFTLGLPALAYEMAKFHSGGDLSELVSRWLADGVENDVDDVDESDDIDLSRYIIQRELMNTGRMKEFVEEDHHWMEEDHKPPIEQAEIAQHLQDMLETAGDLLEDSLDMDDSGDSENHNSAVGSDEPDLDDFFEYFCKHELQLSDAQIRDFVSERYTKKREYNDESDYKSDSE